MLLVYVAGGAAACLAVYLLIRHKDLTFVLREKELELTHYKIELAALEERLILQKEMQSSLKETFQVLSSEVLEASQKQFWENAKASFDHLKEVSKEDLEKKQGAILDVLKPVRESLGKLDEGMRLLEKERKGEQEVLKEQIRALSEGERLLRKETEALVKALRAPATRGRWGELQLKRVIEMAGMLEHCDFTQQVVLDNDTRQRPDVVVHLSGGRSVVVDAKTPLEAYLDAIETDNEEHRLFKLKEHARHIRDHMQDLSRKSYWDKLDVSPEFVVLFLPSETIFSVALEQDPTLIELGAAQRVILATPTTLIALLRAVAYGWKHEKLSQKAEEISALGAELYKRLSDLSIHFARLGKSLGSSVESYNKAIGTLESRVLVSARRFEEMGSTSETVSLPSLEPLLLLPREVQVLE